MTFDIVEYHDGLVDQDPPRQRQPAQVMALIVLPVK
ncbi:MAG: hypothetical protein Ct9H300mP1_39430 [Planctomycetaceae bacterium]|nr:MAG: hypothetical protein Ct9H300mP1_39430 [Planctomycetaceae bacterium]